MPKPGRAAVSGLENKVMRVIWQQGQATAEVVGRRWPRATA